MGIEYDLDQRQSRGPRAVLAAVLLIAPAAIFTILFFGGGQVNQCHALHGCGEPPPPALFSVIGRTEVLIIVVLALIVSWLFAVLITIRHLWSSDRARLGRATAAAVGLVLATATVVATVRLVEDQGRRIAAEDAGLYALGVAIIAIPLVLAWAVLTGRRPASRP